ncbi:peptide chain release factor 1 [Methanobrevibacter sp. 87.7]|uniref:peptide chain release factor aRF-1 n=1 Tax=Methanobrevibacter sp. 87.7 TaxID=387957 RepID=UPI000B5136AE|nr:peptide chain release factor aRF-1 [Methanobrevibacter sp. 87.7]OWT32365.1 peptide chain release factor 1 [Methanobrevibacter sp. 87.7]
MTDISSKELYEFKKTIKNLSQKKGRGTELVSVYIPHSKQISDVAKQMRDELGQSSNIKSKSTRKNVQSAIEVIIQRIKLFKQAPENGLVLFTGMIPRGGPGTEKMETYVFEPPEPITTYWYICDSSFYLEPLEEMVSERDVYGICVIDRKEATIATLKGKHINIIATLTSGVPGKHKAGGQSQRRFDRVIEDAAREFLKRIGRHVNEAYLPIKDDLKGVLLGGPGNTKIDFYEGDFMQYEIKDKVITTVDTSYTGEFGIREVIDKASDTLEELDVMKEKKIVQKFLHELINDKTGLASYGEDEVRRNLQIGAVDTLLLSEGLKLKRVTMKCPQCGWTKNITPRKKDDLDFNCEKCNEHMKEDKSVDLVDTFVEMAEEVGSNVELISTETEEGMQLYRAFGGIAAILRYHI